MRLRAHRPFDAGISGLLCRHHPGAGAATRAALASGDDRTPLRVELLAAVALAILDKILLAYEATDVDTVAAVNMLEQSGLLSVGRAEEILGGDPSPVEVIAPAVFVPTHLVDGYGPALLGEDGTVRFENGRWSTAEALTAMGKTLEAL